MFRIDYDPAANRMHMRVKGFWKPEDVPALAAAVGARIREIRRTRDDFDTLVESLDFPVQDSHVADLLANIKVAGMTQTSGRTAVVVGSHLNRLQAERTLAHERLRVFMTIADAEAWLAG